MNLFRILLVAMLTVPMTASAALKVAAPVQAPAFHLPARTGFVDSDSLRGKVVLVDFWASWCGPCRRSFPWMSELHAKYAERGLEIVAINLDKQRPLADAFLLKYPAPFTIAFDPAGSTAEAFKVAAMPTSFLISRDGNVLGRHIGFEPKQAAEFEESIKEALSR